MLLHRTAKDASASNEIWLLFVAMFNTDTSPQTTKDAAASNEIWPLLAAIVNTGISPQDCQGLCLSLRQDLASVCSHAAGKDTQDRAD